MRLSKIADGKESSKDFLNEIENDIKKLVSHYQQ